jgi:hypothetical protein
MNGILDDILKELKREKKSSSWPVHIVAQAAMISAPAGTILQQACDFKYEADNQEEQLRRLEVMKDHAIITAAQCIRFLENLKTLEKDKEVFVPLTDKEPAA